MQVVCLDSVTRHDLVVTLDWDYGEFVGRNDAWPGFQEVATAIARHLPGVDPDWVARAALLRPGQSLEIWQRP